MSKSENYARTKYKGETSALKYNNSIAIRTNVTGLRNKKNKPTFIEWLMKSILSKEPIELYNDFYTSTIDSITLASYAIDLFHSGYRGLINIGSSECSSKEEFAIALANKLNIDLNWYTKSSVKTLVPKRAESLGLDCSLVSQILRKRMPSIDEVLESLIMEFKN